MRAAAGRAQLFVGKPSVRPECAAGTKRLGSGMYARLHVETFGYTAKVEPRR